MFCSVARQENHLGAGAVFRPGNNITRGGLPVRSAYGLLFQVYESGNLVKAASAYNAQFWHAIILTKELPEKEYGKSRKIQKIREK